MSSAESCCHFALETHGDEIAARMLEFLGRTLR